MSLLLSRLGTEYITHRVGDPGQARQALEEALALARETGKLQRIGEALGFLGNFIMQVGDYREARQPFEESLSVARQTNDKGLTSGVLLSLGDIARLDGDYARARSMYEECVTLSEAGGVKVGRAFALVNLAYIYLKEGNPTATSRHLAESVALFQQMSHSHGLAQCLVAFAALDLLNGNLPRAIKLLSFTRSALDRKEVVLDKADLLAFEEQLSQARALANEVVRSSAWLEGQALTLAQAMEYALASGHS
jgi:hypothetical protein